jgi:threonine 3-dehydrogenase
MTTLITGGTGFIGAEVARCLLENDATKLVLFDINPSMQRLDDMAQRVEFVRGDLGNFSHVLNIVQATKPDVIYHLGGMLSVPSEADPPAAIAANALGTYHVLEAARLFQVRQILFASTIGTYGSDIRAPVIDDYTLQRPQTVYGVTKVFAENLGRFYKRKYGLDFRGVRYPSIVGPGVRTPGVAQYTSWVIEECAKGKPFTIKARPETAVPVLYFKDAARALIQLAAAPLEAIQMVVYVVGVGLTPTAQELADVVRAKIPGATIRFEADPALQGLLDRIALAWDDSLARKEWHWAPMYGQEQMVDDFLRELRLHPQRYA